MLCPPTRRLSPSQTRQRWLGVPALWLTRGGLVTLQVGVSPHLPGPEGRVSFHRCLAWGHVGTSGRAGVRLSVTHAHAFPLAPCQQASPGGCHPAGSQRQAGGLVETSICVQASGLVSGQLMFASLEAEFQPGTLSRHPTHGKQVGTNGSLSPEVPWRHVHTPGTWPKALPRGERVAWSGLSQPQTGRGSRGVRHPTGPPPNSTPTSWAWFYSLIEQGPQLLGPSPLTKHLVSHTHTPLVSQQPWESSGRGS